MYLKFALNLYEVNKLSNFYVFVVLKVLRLDKIGSITFPNTKSNLVEGRNIDYKKCVTLSPLSKPNTTQYTETGDPQNDLMVE